MLNLALILLSLLPTFRSMPTVRTILGTPTRPNTRVPLSMLLLTTPMAFGSILLRPTKLALRPTPNLDSPLSQIREPL